MEIKILGTGCPKCKNLESMVREIVARNGIEATVSKVDDIMDIMSYNVISTPAMVIDGKVVVRGRVPSAAEIESLLNKK